MIVHCMDSLIETSPPSPIVVGVWRASQESHLWMTLHNLNFDQWNNAILLYSIVLIKRHDDATVLRNTILKEFHDKEAVIWLHG